MLYLVRLTVNVFSIKDSLFRLGGGCRRFIRFKSAVKSNVTSKVRTKGRRVFKKARKVCFVNLLKVRSGRRVSARLLRKILLL